MAFTFRFASIESSPSISMSARPAPCLPFLYFAIFLFNSSRSPAMSRPSNSMLFYSKIINRIYKEYNIERYFILSYIIIYVGLLCVLFLTLPAWSAIWRSVFANLIWAWIWARSSCIFLQLSAYCLRTSSIIVVVNARPTKM